MKRVHGGPIQTSTVNDPNGNLVTNDVYRYLLNGSRLLRKQLEQKGKLFAEKYSKSSNDGRIRKCASKEKKPRQFALFKYFETVMNFSTIPIYTYLACNITVISCISFLFVWRSELLKASQSILWARLFSFTVRLEFYVYEEKRINDLLVAILRMFALSRLLSLRQW